MQFESEPAGAEARTSLGQTCRTPCSLAVAANEFTVSFTLPGYQPQTVPVRIVTSTEVGTEGEAAPPRLVPNPVFVELHAGRRPRRGAAPRSRRPSRNPSPRRSPPRTARRADRDGPRSARAGGRAGLALAAAALALRPDFRPK